MAFRMTSVLTRIGLSSFTFRFRALEKAMATHSSVLACRIPGMGEPGGLPCGVAQSRTRLKRLSSSMYMFFFFFFYIPFHYRLLQGIKYSSLCYTVGLSWLSILYIVVCIV